MRLLPIQTRGGKASCGHSRGADDTISASWTLYHPPLAPVSIAPEFLSSRRAGDMAITW